jgi:outer membrane cobalamin receptor
MRVAAVLSVFAVVACSSATKGTSRDRMIIRADEIATVQAANAYDIVSKLRGSFLRTRGPTSTRNITSPPSIMVFLDGILVGPVDNSLKQIPATEVQEIRLYSATDAVTKYGSRFNGGVIDVMTARAGRP